MKEDDKRLEELMGKLMSADSLDQAPVDFTNKVMSKIESLSETKKIVYQPLIPKYVWWLMAATFVSLIVYMRLSAPNNNTSLLERYNLPDFSFNLLEGLSLDFSNTLIYAVVLFAIMLCIQIPLLKQYFNNRLSIQA
ncbi:hypothetical protein [Winogradskyella ursingii]|uniref:hypothetical protein n=1 Tax=Winogradskyella ursingii TaxID=2686079 RepID=UPI0015C85ACD|nr:hypothetical protein [Winogradskyella ursingii]